MVVRRRNLDDVGAHQVERLQRTEHLEQLTAVQPTDLRRARSRGERGVEDVDVDREVDREVVRALDDRAGRAGDSERAEVAGPYRAEAETAVVPQGGGSRDRAAGAAGPRAGLR